MTAAPATMAADIIQAVIIKEQTTDARLYLPDIFVLNKSPAVPAGLSLWGMKERITLKSAEEINCAMELYADMVRRICFVHLKDRHDTEDVFQNVYLKYMLYEGTFESREHEKAWFARVTINACTDWLRSFARRKWVPLDVIAEEREALDDTSGEVLEVVLKLPEKYRNVIYLFYFEGYSAVEIAGILGHKENTIYTWLARAKNLLRENLGGEWA